MSIRLKSGIECINGVHTENQLEVVHTEKMPPSSGTRQSSVKSRPCRAPARTCAPLCLIVYPHRQLMLQNCLNLRPPLMTRSQPLSSNLLNTPPAITKSASAPNALEKSPGVVQPPLLTIKFNMICIQVNQVTR